MRPLLVCPNGHAMDDGYTECPACGAYRAPRSIVTCRYRDCPRAPLRGWTTCARHKSAGCSMAQEKRKR